MKERPILFMDSMVLAILSGEKTVTRRVGKTWARVKPGDVLWVREAHAILHGCCWPDLPHAKGPGDAWTFYRAGFDRCAPRWRPSIHMPRWACRIRLRVTSVDAEPASGPGAPRMPWIDDAEARREGFADRAAFMATWTKMHADHDGEVYRVAFEVIE